MAQFVDWDLAAATAGALGKSGPRVSYDEATDVVADLRRRTEEAAGHVAAYTGLRSQVAHPPVRIVDRRDWAATNIAGLREVVTPLVARLSGDRQPGAVTEAIGSRLTGVQAGTVLAYLSGRVLGQYEVFSGDPGQLLLVAPNIVEVERKLEADPGDFRLWVCLHEVTHRTQFTAVPWMRGHFLGEVQAFVDASQSGGDNLLDRLRRGVATISDLIRDPESRTSVLDIVQTPAQRAVLDRLTALMTLLEGHAEFVMDGVGPEVIPSVDQIRLKFNRRREAGNPVEKAVRRLLGIDVKMRQYAEGRKFVHAVVERVGMDGFNKVFDSPLTLPRLSELTDPDAWVRRVHGPAGPLLAAG
ncbi:zinc-dependent metalloprotease [Micromonospora sp. NPDC049559]|uniref:zinc-dependent metalloprotease n=1 Tax=Micromonospora sp. NPDC049559 TaxID=3155923 RepID=UPI00341614A5